MADEQKISDEAAWAFDEAASAHRKKHGGTFRHCCTRAGVEAAYSLLRNQWETERGCVLCNPGSPEEIRQREEASAELDRLIVEADGGH